MRKKTKREKEVNPDKGGVVRMTEGLRQLAGILDRQARRKDGTATTYDCYWYSVLCIQTGGKGPIRLRRNSLRIYYEYYHR